LAESCWAVRTLNLGTSAKKAVCSRTGRSRCAQASARAASNSCR